MNGTIIEKEMEAGLRVIGLCELYGRRQVRGSEAAAHAQRMLLLYRLSYWRRFGRSATQDEVRQAMWRRAMEMQGEAVEAPNSGYIENSCNGYYHDPAYHKGANMHKQKGGRSAGGNPRNATTKSNTPLKAAPNAKPQAQVNAVAHALKATEKKGKVQGAAYIDGKPIDIETGNKNFHGTQHYNEHNLPNDTPRRKAARAIGVGNYEPEPNDKSKIRRRKGETNASLAIQKGGRYKFITAHKKK